MPTSKSVAVILSAGGSTLDLPALTDLPGARLLRAEFAWGDKSACVAATLEHDCHHSELAARLRRWAAGRGWAVTVAPLAPSSGRE